MPTVFISYSSKDGRFVDELVKKLRRRRIGVWIDKWEIKVGESIIERIGEGIKQNDFLIVVLSRYSVTSPWVREEIRIAYTKGLVSDSVVILPVLIEDCEIPEFLKHRKYADFRFDYQQGFYDLLLAIDPRKAQSFYRSWQKSIKTEEPKPLPIGVRFGRFGELKVYVLAGGETGSFRREDIEFTYEDIPKILPDDLERTRQELLAQLRDEAQQRGSPLEDNPLVYVRKLGFRTEAFDKLHITLGPSSYYQYAPFMYRLDERLHGRNESIREAYFATPWDFESSPVPSEVSVNLNVICDRSSKILILQRAQQVAVAPGRMAEAVGGAVNRERDWDSTIDSPSPFLAAVHEAKEELNLDISPDEVTFRAIIIGLEDPAVCFLGDVNVDVPSEIILKASRFASHKEGVGYHAIRFTPEAVSNFLRHHGDNITDISLFTILSTLCASRYFGWKNTEKAFRD